MAKYSKIFSNEENLRKVISECINKTQCLLKLDVNPAGGNFKTLDSYIHKFGIDTSHFLGHGSNLGRSSPKKKSALEYCFKGSRIKSHTLKLKLIRDGVKEVKCEKCGITEWQGKEVPIELDHIDGNKYNNELLNLQILCPNCHSLKTREQPRLKYKDHKDLIKNFKDIFIEKEITSTITKKERVKHFKNKCKICSSDTNNKVFCSYNCMYISNGGNIPSKEELINKIEVLGNNFSALGREFNVSDNAIRKWFRKYNLK